MNVSYKICIYKGSETSFLDASKLDICSVMKVLDLLIIRGFIDSYTIEVTKYE